MADANKNAMTEDYDEKVIHNDIQDNLNTGKKSQSKTLDDFSDSITGLANNNDTPVLPEFDDASEYMKQIGEGNKSPALDKYMTLMPTLPKPLSTAPLSGKCGPFTFGAGKMYEFSINCDYIALFRQIFGYLLYIWSFVSGLEFITTFPQRSVKRSQ
ncbi:hypothetical protein DVQ78_19505 [Yersinia enterocolitica]|nr:hypothetical protein [Yersinia enterocolitica]